MLVLLYVMICFCTDWFICDFDVHWEELRGGVLEVFKLIVRQLSVKLSNEFSENRIEHLFKTV